MFDLTTTNTDVQIMTSREIAELTGKRHDNVLRDIESIASVLSESSKSITYTGYNNKQQREWHLTKRDTLLVISGYNVELRARIIDRWEELERKQLAEPSDDEIMMRGYMLTMQKYQQLQQTLVMKDAVIEVQEEQIHNLQNLFNEGMTPSAFVKQLNGCNANAISAYLEEIGWSYSRERKAGKDWFVYAGVRDKFLRQSSYCPNLSYPQVRVHTVQLTKQGAVKLYGMYLEGKLPMKKGWDGKFTHDVI